MNTYQNTKPTNIAWLGEVPSHWEILPIRSIFCFRNEKNNPIKTENILSLSIVNGVTQYSEENRGGNKRKDDLTAYKLAYENDIVLNSMNVVVGAVGRSKYFGAISPVYYALYLHNNDDIRFYEYIFSNNSFQRSLLKYGKGILIKVSDNGKLNTIRMKISQDDLKTIIFPKPPLPEQTAIANFLDCKTTQIQKAIALKSEQIAKLKEYRQTLINQTVTQGLNPTVPMKNSGVEWLGEVPKHWEVKKLKFISDINLQTLPENTNKNIMIDYVDIGSVSFENGIEKIEQFTFGNAPSRARRIAKAGDTIVSTVRTYLKAISIVTDEFKNCIFSTGFAILSPKNGIDNKFLANMIKSDAFTIQVTVNSKGMSYPAINSTELSNLFVVVPPLSEQIAIAEFLDEKTAQIDTAIRQYQTQIDKLKEYQQSLVSDVVTGKVKVSDLKNDIGA